MGELVVTGSEGRVPGEDSLKLGLGLGITVSSGEDHAIVRVDDGGKRVERKSGADLLAGFVEPVLWQEKRVGVEVVGLGAIGIQLQGTFKFVFGLSPFPQLRKCTSTGRVSFGK